MKHDTPHRPDDDLDDLFRRAAGAYEPPFNPKAWKRMQQKLDGGTRPLVRRLYLFGLLEGFFVLAVLLFIWTDSGAPTGRSPEPDRRTGTAAVPTTTTAAGKRADGTGVPLATPDRVPAAQPSEASGPAREAFSTESVPASGEKIRARPTDGTPEATARSTPDRTASDPRRVSQPLARPVATPTTSGGRSQSVMTRPEKRSRTKITFPGARVASRRTRQNLWRTRGEEVPEDRRVRRETGSAAVDPVPLARAEGVGSLSVEALRRRSPRWPLFAGTLPALALPAVPPRVEPVRLRPARWSGLLLASPDFTNVPGRSVGNTGYNVGVQLEFRPLTRLRLGLGANYATKLYDASSYDYRPPYPGYWQRWGRPERIEADCRILELPFSLRYDVLQRERSALSVSVGSSSYLMLNEHYFYRFPSGYEHNEYAKRSGNHWLATMNVAIGYERTIARRLALRVEPFVKLPRGGVGKGDVRLRTAGVAFGLRYDFPRH